MTEPLVEGEPVQIVLVLVRMKSMFGGAGQLRQYVGHRVRKLVVSSSVVAGVPWARERWLGPNIRPLAPEQEGISWCRGWSAEARDALSAAWNLDQSARGPT